MPLMLCSADNVNDWFSAVGVKSRFDDVNAGASGSLTVEESERLDRMIAQSSAIVAAKLGVRFKKASFAGANPPATVPPLVTYFATVVACRYISSRRNLPVNAEITRQYEEVMKWLDDIVAGNMQIPDVPDSFDFTAFVSNLSVDGSYFTAKIRRVEVTSTGGHTGVSRKEFTEDSPFTRFQ